MRSTRRSAALFSINKTEKRRKPTAHRHRLILPTFLTGRPPPNKHFLRIKFCTPFYIPADFYFRVSSEYRNYIVYFRRESGDVSKRKTCRRWQGAGPPSRSQSCRPPPTASNRNRLDHVAFSFTDFSDNFLYRSTAELSAGVFRTIEIKCSEDSRKGVGRCLFAIINNILYI